MIGISFGLLSLMLYVGVCVGQRPPYVSKPLSYPGVLPQYTTEDSVGDRFGASNTTTTTSTPATVLPGSLHEQDLINRVSEWPKDKQPFWFINNQQISDHRGYQKPNGTGGSQPGGGQGQLGGGQGQLGGGQGQLGGGQGRPGGGQSQLGGGQGQPGAASSLQEEQGGDIANRFQFGSEQRQPADEESGWLRPGRQRPQNRWNRN